MRFLDAKRTRSNEGSGIQLVKADVLAQLNSWLSVKRLTEIGRSEICQNSECSFMIDVL